MGSLLLLFPGCLPPILGDTGLPPDSGVGDAGDSGGDDGDTSETGAPDDLDGDGFGSKESTDRDCDDANPGIYPGAPEYFNTMDENCDDLLSGRLDEFADVTVSADDAGVGEAVAMHTSRGNAPGFVGLGYIFGEGGMALVAASSDLLAGGFQMAGIRAGLSTAMVDTLLGYSMDIQDVDDNGVPDFVAGAPLADDNRGAAYVVKGRAWGGIIDVAGALPLGVTVIEPPDDATSALAGIAVAAHETGIAVGAIGNTVGGAWVFPGEELPDGIVTLTDGMHISDSSLGTNFGAALGVSALGSEGEIWLAVGAPSTSADDTNAGRVYAWPGYDLGSGLELTTDDAEVVINGGEPDLYFGGAFGDPGDIDGDGYPDPLVGAGYSGRETRTLFVLDGAALGRSADATRSFLARIDGLAPFFENFQDFTWGDFNGDMKTDVVVSRATEDGGEVRLLSNYDISQHSVVVFDETTAFILGKNESDGFGVALASLDDLGGPALLAAAPATSPRGSLYAIPTHP